MGHLHALLRDNAVEPFYGKSELELERTVKEIFDFLCDDGASYRGLRRVRGDIRDTALVWRYALEEVEVDIAVDAWLMPSIGLRYQFAQKSKVVPLEPLLFFLSQGRIQPLIPTVYPSLSGSLITKVVKNSEALDSRTNYRTLIESLADRLKEHLMDFRGLTKEEIDAFVPWYHSYTGVEGSLGS
jgi:hypothetical protein